MPAANERALEKAKGISTDAIIYDLEDAVSPDSKDIARAQAIAAVNSGNTASASSPFVVMLLQLRGVMQMLPQLQKHAYRL